MDHSCEDEQGTTYDYTVFGEKQRHYSTQDSGNLRKALQSGTPMELTRFSIDSCPPPVKNLSYRPSGRKKSLIKQLLKHVSGYPALSLHY
jgi:hypothetical protein